MIATSRSRAGRRGPGLADDMPASPLVGIDLSGVVGTLKSNVAPQISIPDYSSYLPDMRPTWRQLVVIGNGFDLACHLKSDFGSFFKPRFEKMRAIEHGGVLDGKSVGFQLRAAGLTVWDIVLSDCSGDNWYDVEAAISKWVRPCEQPHFIDLLDSVFALEFSGRKWQHILPPSESTERRVRRYLIEGMFGLEDDYSRDKLNKLLLDELHRLEDAFDVYLTKQVEKTSQYPEDARQLLYELIMRDRPNEEDFRTELSVLSFNYTSSREMQFDNSDGTIPYVNVHGKLGEDIIFGVDGKGMMTNANVVPFTKTYRLMAKGGPQHYEVLPGDVRLIKFFGHSLASADYSYFQAIFDAVNLYDGDTRLVFYYRPYAGKSDLEVRTEMMDRVTGLLSTYGETLDNINHGNNLIHRLLLEGRLSIELI